MVAPGVVAETPEEDEEAAKGHFEGREFLRQFQEVESLPDDDKLVVKKLLDAFLTKKQIQRLAG